MISAILLKNCVIIAGQSSNKLVLLLKFAHKEMPNQPSFVSRARQALPKELKQFLQPLLEKAYQAQNPIYLIGGCVRDLIPGRPSLDIDMVVVVAAASLSRAAAQI